jgi:hypothetical protein
MGMEPCPNPRARLHGQHDHRAVHLIGVPQQQGFIHGIHRFRFSIALKKRSLARWRPPAMALPNICAKRIGLG